MDILYVAGDAVAGVHIAQGRIFPAGHEDGQIFLGGGQQPTVLGVDLVGGLEVARAQNPVHEFVGEKPFAGLIGADPLLQNLVLDAAHGLHLGDAGVGDAVHVAREQLGFIGRGQIAVAGNALIKIVGHEVEDVFFQVGAGAADAVNLVLADHLGQRQAQLGGTHGAANGDEHLAARGQQVFVSFGGVNQRRGVEMAIMVLDKRRN